MAKLVNRAKVYTATTGTGTITLGSPVASFQSFADAGLLNGETVRYVIEDNADWEIGVGTYSSTGPTLTRTPSESSNAGSAINLSGNAWVFVTGTGDELLQTANNLSDLENTETARTNLDVDQAGTALALAIALG